MSRFAEYLPRPDSDPRPAPLAVLDVRMAEPGDLPRIAALMAERDGGDVASHLDPLGRELGAIRGGAHRALWVEAIDGTVVAYARAQRFEPPADAPANTAPAGWYLTGVIVDPALRRRGIGEALTAARIAWLAGRADTVYYFANARNAPTIDMHARLGFREVTRDFTFPGVTFTGGAGILFAAAAKAR